jgi:uncharacterized membrane protein
MKKYLQIKVDKDFLEISYPYGIKNEFMKRLVGPRTLRDVIWSMIIEIDNIDVFYPQVFPHEFHIRLDNNICHNQYLSSILDLRLESGTSIGIIIPLKHSIKPGMHRIIVRSTLTRFKVSFKFEILENKEIITIPQDRTNIIQPILLGGDEKSSTKDFEEKAYISKKIYILIALLALLASVFYEIIIFFGITSQMIIYGTSIYNLVFYLQSIIFFVVIGIIYSYIKSKASDELNQSDTPKSIRYILIAYYLIFSGYFLISQSTNLVDFLLSILLIPLTIVTIVGWQISKVNLKRLNANKQSEGPVLKALLFGFIIVPLAYFHITNHGINTFLIIILAGIGFYLVKKRKILKIQVKNAKILLILIVIIIPIPILLDRFYIRNNLRYTETYSIHPAVSGQIIVFAESFDHTIPRSWNYTAPENYETITSITMPSERYDYRDMFTGLSELFFIPYLYHFDYFVYELTAIPITSLITLDYINNSETISLNSEVNITGSHFADMELDEFQLNYIYLNSSVINVPSNVSQAVQFTNGTLVRIFMEQQWERGFYYAFGTGNDWYQEYVFIFDEDDNLLVVLILGSINYMAII